MKGFLRHFWRTLRCTALKEFPLTQFRTVETPPPNLDKMFGNTKHEGELMQLYAGMSKRQHYALQYPDGTYAWESNCQGWGSTNLKPKIGDPWCFTAHEAVLALRDLRNCKLIPITEHKNNEN